MGTGEASSRIRLLTVGSAISLMVAIAGGILAWQNWDESSALNESGAFTRFGIIVGMEIALAAIGAVVLSMRKLSRFLSIWICMVVGVHFWPMAPLFDDPWFYVLGAALVSVAIITFLITRRSLITPSAITGLGTGSVLLIFAICNLVRAIL